VDDEKFEQFAQRFAEGWGESKVSVGGRSRVGARVLELTPAQRVALHFTTPGDASRETLIQFVKMIEPTINGGKESQFNESWDVSQIRDYAYDLWLEQTDDKLYALAESISGGQGVIHPTIQQELEDAVKRYQTQYEDVIASGKRAIRNLETQVDTLKTKEQQTKLKGCIAEIRSTIEPNVDKVPCTKIPPGEPLATDKQINNLPTSKWLSYLGLSVNDKRVKFLNSMSTKQLDEFANYLVSQSAIGICRLSNVLREMSDALQMMYQSAKDDVNAPVPDIKQLETLRFLEWVMRRPPNSVDKHDELVTWILKYPYIQGKMEGTFKRKGERSGVTIPLSAKYVLFSPKSQEDQILSALFGVTNPGNISLMKQATESDVFTNVF
jgi:hypothetical protein